MHSQKRVHLSKQRCRDRHTHTYIHTQSLPRSIGADTHRHLLDRFPSTWGRHPAIRLPPSLYQQEGALRCCCSSEPAQLDTKYCREPLSFTPAGRRGEKKRYSSSNRTLPMLLCFLRFPWLGRCMKTSVYMHMQEHKNCTYYKSKHRTQCHDTLHSQSVRKMAEALKCTVNNRQALDLNRETIFKYYQIRW